MIKEQKEKEFEKIRCSRCGSAFGYVQIRTNTWKCRKCNFEEDLNKKLED